MTSIFSLSYLILLIERNVLSHYRPKLLFGNSVITKIQIWGKNDTFLHWKRMSLRKLFLVQGKVFPRAVFNPPRVGLYIPSEARAVIETQGGLKTARGYTFV